MQPKLNGGGVLGDIAVGGIAGDAGVGGMGGGEVGGDEGGTAPIDCRTTDIWACSDAV